jgi:uncharacterized protein YodC (DUF2158 family)
MSRNSAAAAFAAIVFGGFVCVWGGPGHTEPVKSDALVESVAARAPAPGDLVHLRSGGPLMTVEKVDGDQVICHWSTEFGELRSGSFRLADLSAPITLPPPDPNEKNDEAAVDRYYRKHCPSGFLTFTGKFECAL